jgi:hypothetical protein
MTATSDEKLFDMTEVGELFNGKKLNFMILYDLQLNRTRQEFKYNKKNSRPFHHSSFIQFDANSIPFPSQLELFMLASTIELSNAVKFCATKKPRENFIILASLLFKCHCQIVCTLHLFTFCMIAISSKANKLHKKLLNECYVFITSPLHLTHSTICSCYV